MRPLEKRPHATQVSSKDGRTEQSHLKECDINLIMKRALRGESNPYIRDNLGSYGDATQLSYLDANVLIADANSMFEELPSNIRNRFKNSTSEFLEFINDPKNKSEASDLGLIKKIPKEEPTPEPDPGIKSTKDDKKTTVDPKDPPTKP